MTGSSTPWKAPSAQERLKILQQASSIAIVGASNNSARASYFVGTYLLSSTDYTVWFVNPRESEILGHPAYASVADLPTSPDIVDVFRKPSDLPEVLDDALASSASTLWLQLGIEDPDIAEKGHQAGLNIVMNRCIKIEHARFHGGLHLAGFNTGVIRSTRSLA
ncbi:MAG: CoA-binding protein [Candidatus Nanopelagicales bacterium]|nr:CoA-binding protein [Candidatus Nanopelagicales bacterium]